MLCLLIEYWVIYICMLNYVEIDTYVSFPTTMPTRLPQERHISVYNGKENWF